jgi:hypothetical protein
MREQIRQQQLGRWWSMALVLLVVGALAAVITLPHTTRAAMDNALNNGSFEQGFVALPGCGSEGYESNVGVRWGCFTNRGAARYGFYADAWAPVVADGQYSQLIEINTWNIPNGDNYRYAGIYQTVPVMPATEYRLSLRGMIRTTNLEGDPWRYRVQVGTLPGGTEWRGVEDWIDVGWDTYYLRDAPGAFSDFQTIVKSKSDRLTIFIRVWKKWGITNEELDVNLDAITLENVGAPKPKKP